MISQSRTSKTIKLVKYNMNYTNFTINSLVAANSNSVVNHDHNQQQQQHRQYAAHSIKHAPIRGNEQIPIERHHQVNDLMKLQVSQQQHQLRHPIPFAPAAPATAHPINRPPIHLANNLPPFNATDLIRPNWPTLNTMQQSFSAKLFENLKHQTEPRLTCLENQKSFKSNQAQKEPKSSDISGGHDISLTNPAENENDQDNSDDEDNDDDDDDDDERGEGRRRVRKTKIPKTVSLRSD